MKRTLKTAAIFLLVYSGGAPFALACASKIPERIYDLGIVSGMGPVKDPKAKKGASMMIPKAPNLILSGMKRMMEKKPDKFETAHYVSETLPNCEARFMENEGHLTLIYKNGEVILKSLGAEI